MSNKQHEKMLLSSVNSMQPHFQEGYWIGHKHASDEAQERVWKVLSEVLKTELESDTWLDISANTLVTELKMAYLGIGPEDLQDEKA